MNVSFATCDRSKAFDYIKQVYPSRDVQETEVSKLLDLVERDVVRIQDPFMYGKRIAVEHGKNWKPTDELSLQIAVAQLKENNFI